MHHRQGQREAARHTHRRPHGRFAALSAPSEQNRKTSDSQTIEADTIDDGSCPVTQPAIRENTPLNLPPLEETASIQLALFDVLIDVLQALDKIKRERPEEANPAIPHRGCIRVRVR